MPKKSLNLEQLRAKRPVNEKRVRKLRDSMLTESRAIRLADFRKALELTQEELAAKLGVDQSNVSRIERGRFLNTEIGTLQAYVEALGGTLEINARVGKTTHRLVDSAPIRAK